MIAITVSRLGTDSPASKRLMLSSLYVLGMVITFSILGMVAAFTGGLLELLCKAKVCSYRL